MDDFSVGGHTERLHGCSYPTRYLIGWFTVPRKTVQLYGLAFSLVRLSVGWFISVRISDWLSDQIVFLAFFTLARQPGWLVYPWFAGFIRQDCLIIELPWPGCLICWFTSTKPSDWLVNVDQTVGLAGLHRAGCLIGWFKSTRQSHWLVYVNQTVWLAGLHLAGWLIGWFTLTRLFDSLVYLG